MTSNNPTYLTHYENLCMKYGTEKEIVSTFRNNMENTIRNMAESDDHYRYKIYLSLNPELKSSDFVYSLEPYKKTEKLLL